MPPKRKLVGPSPKPKRVKINNCEQQKDIYLKSLAEFTYRQMAISIQHDSGDNNVYKYWVDKFQSATFNFAIPSVTTTLLGSNSLLSDLLKRAIPSDPVIKKYSNELFELIVAHDTERSMMNYSLLSSAVRGRSDLVQRVLEVAPEAVTCAPKHVSRSDNPMIIAVINSDISSIIAITNTRSVRANWIRDAIFEACKQRNVSIVSILLNSDPKYCDPDRTWRNGKSCLDVLGPGSGAADIRYLLNTHLKLRNQKYQLRILNSLPLLPHGVVCIVNEFFGSVCGNCNYQSTACKGCVLRNQTLLEIDKRNVFHYFKNISS